MIRRLIGLAVTIVMVVVLVMLFFNFLLLILPFLVIAAIVFFIWSLFRNRHYGPKRPRYRIR